MAAPANDNVVNAQVLTGTSTTGSTVEATAEPGEVRYQDGYASGTRTFQLSVRTRSERAFGTAGYARRPPPKARRTLRLRLPAQAGTRSLVATSKRLA
jgi:hypothetical protein